MADINVHIIPTGLAVGVGGVKVEPHRPAAAIEGTLLVSKLNDRLSVVHRARADVVQVEPSGLPRK